ncbi:MAG: sugar phosphate isomerase/epimerase, partial [Acidimicrobiia bacterium]|nr:sugar phosphate isomerase/epimerase [Acidimicrobiia bacterium]
FKADMAGTFDMVKGFGITDIEMSNLFGQEPAKIRALMDARGIACSSYGAPYNDVLKKTDEVAAVAKTLGAQYVRVSLPFTKTPFDKAAATQRAAEMNAMGKQLREKHGLTFVLHNHGMEFVPEGQGTLYDFLHAQTRPEDVSFELDVLWAYLPGADPVAIFEKYGARIPLMHVKDVRKGVPRTWGHKYDSDNDVTLGTGQLDQAAIFAAAKKAGVKHYYLEDESSHSQAQVPRSIATLKADR